MSKHCGISRSAEACVFCGREDDDKNLFGGKRTRNNITMHYFCALFSSGLAQGIDDDEDEMWGFVEADVIREVKRALRLRCRFCHKLGSSVGCSVKTCRIMCHYPCGISNGMLPQYYGQFCCYCKEHRPRQTTKDLPSFKQSLCSICLLSVDTTEMDDVLLTPCCRNALLHRECIQQQAVASGMHFFKCPLCNDKDRFQAEMLTYGIYIPDQDAAWELESDAYTDLLERHSCCDVAKCRCPDGRRHNVLDSRWEILLCDYCGSTGTHLACSGLATPMDDWVCDICKKSVDTVEDQREKLTGRSTVGAVSSGVTGSSATSKNSRKRLNSSPYMSYASKRLSSPQKSLTCRPRPRRLSRYLQLKEDRTGADVVNSTTAECPQVNMPRWLRGLLNDDVHTGRNIGEKLAYLCCSDIRAKSTSSSSSKNVADVADRTSLCV